MFLDCSNFPSIYHKNLRKMVIFDSLGQYLHQMKAENISNLNLISKYKICFEIFAEILHFIIFHLFFQKFFFKIQIFQKISRLTSEFKFITH